MTDEPTPPPNGTLTPEDRLMVLATARAIAQDLLRFVKMPVRREILRQTAWILEGSTGVQD